MNQAEVDYAAYAKSVSFYVYFYQAILIVPSGTVLNILTVIIFSSSRFKKTNFGFINILITWSELICLIFTCVVYKLLSYVNADPSNYSDVVCFFFQFTGRLIQQIPVYIQLFLSMYQYLEISNMNGALLRRKVFIGTVVFVQLSIVALINFPNFYKRIQYKNVTIASNNQTYLKVSCDHSFELALLSSVQMCLMRAIIPFVLLIIINYLIARSLFRSKKKFSPYQKSGGLAKGSSSFVPNREFHFAFCLFANNMIYFVFNLPVSVTYVTVMLYDNFIRTRPIENTQMQLAHGMTNAIAIFYNALPFFIHFWLNRAFRQSAVSIFRLDWLRPRNGNPTTGIKANLPQSSNATATSKV